MNRIFRTALCAAAALLLFNACSDEGGGGEIPLLIRNPNPNPSLK